MITREREEVEFTSPAAGKIMVWSFAVAAAFMVSQYSYLLFHTAAEVFSIIVAALIYVLASRTYQYSRNDFLLFLAIAYLNVSVIDFLHLVTYPGMNILPQSNGNLATQLWLAGRLMEAASLLVASWFLKRKVFFRRVLLEFLLATAIIALLLSYNLVPVALTPGAGITAFKIYSEYVICLILLAGGWVLYKHRRLLDGHSYKMIQFSIGATVLAELSFTLYSDPYGVLNFTGHIFKALSYALIYNGIVVTGIEKPYNLMTAELKQSITQDHLTGLLNRQGFIKLAENKFINAARREVPIAVLMVNLSNFSEVNKRYYQQAGDQILKEFADILKNTFLVNDLLCRLDADNFLILLPMGNRRIDGLMANLHREVENWRQGNQLVKEAEIEVSTAVNIFFPPYQENMNYYINVISEKIYQEKKKRQRERFLKK